MTPALTAVARAGWGVAAALTWLVASGLFVLPPAAWAGLPDTIERIRPSVVAVGKFQKTRVPAYQFRGTGFAVGDGTLVATNAHVVPDSLRPDQGETIVVLAGAPGTTGTRAIETKVLAVDKEHDVALLRMVGTALPPMQLADSGGVRAGQFVAFTGFPIGNVLGIVPVTHSGIIAAVTPIAIPSSSARQLNERVARRLQSGAFDVFQLDATAYPGNSGSPVYEPETGAVIGLINMVFVKGTKEAALTQPTGISFAVPAEFLANLLKRSQFRNNQ